MRSWVLSPVPLIIIIIVKLSWRPGKETLGKNFAEKMFMWLIHKTGHSGATSQTVATCGGEAVCVIDCQTGIVLHKYKVPGEVSLGALLVNTAGSWDRSPDSIPHDFILVGMEPSVSRPL